MADVDWTKELQDLSAAARTPEEEKSIAAFSQAIHPYLQDSSLLKTLLGKIQAGKFEFPNVAALDHNYESIDELKSKLGDGVNVVEI